MITWNKLNKFYRNIFGWHVGERGSLREMKARICPSGKLLCLWKFKTIETVHRGQQPNLFDHWADTSLHLLLLKSSMGMSFYQPGPIEGKRVVGKLLFRYSMIYVFGLTFYI